jgi:hypothetical protein
MYFNIALFLRALRISLFEQPFRLRRWVYVFFFCALFLTFLGLVILGRALDHLFFWRFRKQLLKQPVFIIAPPRSGTTLTQKLISLDTERFVNLKMYQTIFPAVIFQRCFNGLARLDRTLGRPGERLLGWCEKKWFGGWDNQHKMRLNQPEEDDALFLYAFESEAVYLLFPYVEQLWEAGFLDALSSTKRRKLMRYYRSCLQRHLYSNGPTKTLLSKATQSCGTVESLLEKFPDGRFITIIRHPYQTLPSHVSLFVPVWQAHSPEITKDGDISKAYSRQAIEWYKHLFNFRKQVNPAQYHCIDYRDLVRNPREAIEKVYAHFNWPMSDALRTRLDDASQRQEKFKSKHEYTLEEYGLSKEWIQRDLGELLDFYKLER